MNTQALVLRIHLDLTRAADGDQQAYGRIVAARTRSPPEARLDPVAAARRRRRERMQCWIGSIVGFGCGFGGLIHGLVASGQLAF